MTTSFFSYGYAAHLNEINRGDLSVGCLYLGQNLEVCRRIGHINAIELCIN